MDHTNLEVELDAEPNGQNVRLGLRWESTDGEEHHLLLTADETKQVVEIFRAAQQKWPGFLGDH